jgi:hypothetical protein
MEESMGGRRATVIIAVFLLAAMRSPSMAEEVFGNHTVSAGLQSSQDLTDYQSELNPGSILGEQGGYRGTIRYYLGDKWESGDYSATFQDFGSCDASLDPALSNRIGECYVSRTLFSGFIDIGKKRICQSTGFFRSPINLAITEAKDISHDDQYNLRYAEGRCMANLDLFTGIGFFGLSYMPRIDFDADLNRYLSSSQEEQYLLRYEKTFGAIDAGLAVSRTSLWEAGLQLSTSVGKYAELHGEFVYHENLGQDDRVEGLCGATLNLNRVTGIFEYYYDQAGLDRADWNSRLDEFKLTRDTYGAYPYDPMTVMALGRAYRSLFEDHGGLNARHYAMIRISNPTIDDYQAALAAILNLEDDSGMAMAAYGYDGWEHLHLQVTAAFSFGSDYSEFRLFGERWKIGMEIEFLL